MTTATVRRLTLAEIGSRTFETVEPGICYRLNVPGASVTFEADRLSWRHGELAGELLVRCDFDGTDAVNGVLSVASFNLSSARARTERATQLARQSRASDLPWAPLLEEFCQRVLAAERTGEPAVSLRDIPREETEHRVFRVFGFDINRQHAGILFGDGGAAKSYLALYLAGLMAQEGFRVGLFDWELDAADHRARYEAMFGAAMPAGVFYARCSRPLVHEADRLKRIVRMQGLDFAIYDSIGFACHEAPEKSDSALPYFQAVRTIGVGSLHIAHITKGEGGDQKPFGSAFFHNSARATWFMKPTESVGGNTLTVGVFNRKHNLTHRQSPFAFTVTFDADRTHFQLSDIASVDDFAPQVPLPQRLRALLRAGARSRDDIANEMSDQKPDTLKRIINREIERGALVKFPGSNGQEQIGLAARAS